MLKHSGEVEMGLGLVAELAEPGKAFIESACPCQAECHGLHVSAVLRVKFVGLLQCAQSSIKVLHAGFAHSQLVINDGLLGKLLQRLLINGDSTLPIVDGLVEASQADVGIEALGIKLQSLLVGVAS